MVQYLALVIALGVALVWTKMGGVQLPVTRCGVDTDIKDVLNTLEPRLIAPLLLGIKQRALCCTTSLLMKVMRLTCSVPAVRTALLLVKDKINAVVVLCGEGSALGHIGSTRNLSICLKHEMGVVADVANAGDVYCRATDTCFRYAMYCSRYCYNFRARATSDARALSS
jgi:hypothetical protein